LPTTDPEIAQMLTEISADRIQRSVFILSSFKTRHTFSDPDPTGDGIGAAAGWIRTQMQKAAAESAGRLSVKSDAFTQAPVYPQVPQPVEITNIVGTLAGSHRGSAQRVFVVCAHYDSRVRDRLDAVSPAPGADDDASGVAAVLELERVMARHEFPATIVFVAFAGEEQGLYGSAHWAAGARQRGENIEGVLNNDMIGNTHGPNGTYLHDQVRLFAQGVPPASEWNAELAQQIATGGQNDLPPRELARAIMDCAQVYAPKMNVRLIYRADRYLREGDQMSFLKAGYPAVRFTEPREDYTHEHEDVRTENGVSYGDVPDDIDYVYVTNVARLNGAVLAELARAPAPPRAAEIEIARPENSTTLRWAPSPEAGLAGYRILWRDTTQPFWTHHADVPAGQTRVTLPVNPDDVVFGIEVFDADGHVSRAVLPQPRRVP
jgi:hypothetical protein